MKWKSGILKAFAKRNRKKTQVENLDLLATPFGQTLRALTLTCAHFGRDQIWTQVDARFSPSRQPLTQVNASWVTSIYLLSANEIQDVSALKGDSLQLARANTRKLISNWNARSYYHPVTNLWDYNYTLLCKLVTRMVGRFDSPIFITSDSQTVTQTQTLWISQWHWHSEPVISRWVSH